MMKTIVLTLVVLISSFLPGDAKAYFFTKSELIQKSEVIAIVSIEEPEAAKPAGAAIDPFAEGGGAAGKRWIYSQQAKVRVEKILKGKAPKEFTMYGKESFICAQCVLSKGRFLAFLAKDDTLWVGANWPLSLRPIRGQEVEWYLSEEQRFPMKFQSLNQVVTQIESTLKKPKNSSTRP